MPDCARAEIRRMILAYHSESAQHSVLPRTAAMRPMQHTIPRSWEQDLMMAETSKKLEDNAAPNPYSTPDRGSLHSVADQPQGAARNVGETAAEVVKRAAETAADATRHTAELATRAGEKVVGAVKDTGDTAADVAQETTRSAVT